MRPCIWWTTFCVALLAGTPPAQGNARVVDRQPHEALNDLLSGKDWSGKAGPTRVEPEPLLDVKVLEALNVQRGGSANLTLLRRVGRLKWPGPLAGGDMAKERRRLAETMAEVADLARKGKDVAGASKKALGAYREAQKKLADSAEETTITEYIHAARLLNQLKLATQAVGTPAGAAELKLLDELASKRRTPSELARFLLEHKLKFAPGPPADDAAYEAVRRALGR